MSIGLKLMWENDALVRKYIKLLEERYLKPVYITADESDVDEDHYCELTLHTKKVDTVEIVLRMINPKVQIPKIGQVYFGCITELRNIINESNREYLTKQRGKL